MMKENCSKWKSFERQVMEVIVTLITMLVPIVPILDMAFSFSIQGTYTSWLKFLLFRRNKVDDINQKPK
jgi:hypothetical protein